MDNLPAFILVTCASFALCIFASWLSTDYPPKYPPGTRKKKLWAQTTRRADGTATCELIELEGADD